MQSSMQECGLHSTPPTPLQRAEQQVVLELVETMRIILSCES